MAQAFQIAIAVLANLPGAVAALQGLIEDIRNHGQLSAEEKSALTATAQAAVDAADDRLQKL